ncbi:MAG: aldehyde ferredoxin oxidoreductase family protein [Planctomycetota bacterium]|nr:aldehyde ferredoxin oxidoreductase family protein [Planctomycetota bacterium]
MALNGYAGGILRVCVEKKKHRIESITREFVDLWVGGRGFGAKILYDEVKEVEPLSGGNKVIVATGPLAGTLCPQGAKTSFHTKSPLTGGYADSNMGGLFAPEMRYAGYDALIIEGVSRAPCIIVIDNEKVEIRDGKKYWGKGAIETELALKKELGEEFQIATIGPGGENLVKYACVNHDYGREAGRAGIGAVLGHKKVKAVCIRGDKDIPIADSKTLEEVSKRLFETMRKHPAFTDWQKYGTSQVVPWASEIGALPTRNFQSGTYENAEKLDHKHMRKELVKLDKACFACPMCCGKYSYSRKYNVYCEGSEYETTALLGANCAIESIEDVIYANYLCDELGIDTISAGNVIAFVMEATEKGLMKGCRFGDAQGLFELIKKIAKREGIGDLLAEGVKTVSEKVGGKEFAVQVKGMEQSGYESRGAPSMLLSYLTCDVGAHHNRSWSITRDISEGRNVLEGKAEWVIGLQHKRPMFDMLGLCRLAWVEFGIDLNDYVKAFNAVTGQNWTLDELLLASERVWNLTRCYWFREVKGFGREWDMPYERAMKEPVPDGATKGMLMSKEKVDRLLDDYYRLRGWDKNGKPTKAKLKSLKLSFTISDLY